MEMEKVELKKMEKMEIDQRWEQSIIWKPNILRNIAPFLWIFVKNSDFRGRRKDPPAHTSAFIKAPVCP